MDEQTQLMAKALGEMGRRSELSDFLAQGEACGWCTRPVGLQGYLAAVEPTSGRRVLVSSSAARAAGVVRKACGDRRASRCPSCSSVYRSDARHLVRAGLTGEKGVGEEVAANPAVFLTLTAPSFGAVHRAADHGVCRAANPESRCAHGRALCCFSRHRQDDAVVGTPLCADCYDYEGAVLHNASTPELWRRFVVYLPRALAAVLDVTQDEAKAAMRAACCRVAEFQRRGVVHLHAVIRVDGTAGAAPPMTVDAEALAIACRMAADTVRVPHARGTAVFGSQLDVQVLDGGGNEARRVAAYVAKYATKSTHDSGVLDRRIHHEVDLAERNLPPHLRKMVETAWGLGAEEECQELRLRRYAHALGYGGQFLSKSPSYSTTFTALRGARTAWRRSQLEERLGLRGVRYESHWKAVGRGWGHAGAAVYAHLSALGVEEERRLAWEESRLSG